MITKVQKWGNSLGIRIPKPLTKEAHIETGDQVDIEIENEILTIKPVKPSYDLKDLVTKINKANIHDEVNTGNPIGGGNLVMSKKYIPSRGDIVWLEFNPQTGHEQAGKRPALVISPKIYNQKTGLSLFCPITSQIKGYPFEVKIPSNLKIKGVILCDQIKSLDWKIRKATKIFKIPVDILNDVIAKIMTLIE